MVVLWPGELDNSVATPAKRGMDLKPMLRPYHSMVPATKIPTRVRRIRRRSFELWTCGSGLTRANVRVKENDKTPHAIAISKLTPQTVLESSPGCNCRTYGVARSTGTRQGNPIL